MSVRWQQVGVSVWVNSINVDRIISIHPDPKPFRQRVSRTPHPNCWCSKLTCMLIDTCHHSRVWSIGQRQMQLFPDIYFAASINSNCIYFANCRIISWHSVNSQSNSVISQNKFLCSTLENPKREMHWCGQLAFCKATFKAPYIKQGHGYLLQMESWSEMMVTLKRRVMPKWEGNSHWNSRKGGAGEKTSVEV